MSKAGSDRKPLGPLVEARQKKQAEQDMDNEDFSLGTIAGMEPVSKKTSPKSEVKPSESTTKAKEVKESVADMTVKKKNVEITKNPTTEQLDGTVSLKIRKPNDDLLDLIVKNSDTPIVEEYDTHFKINANQIRVTRQDVESKLGRMHDGHWRMLFMNREGQTSSFNDYEFVLGVVETEVEERKVQAQLNTRILAESKEEMDTTREILGMTQAQFLEIAIKEFAEKVRAEMI